MTTELIITKSQKTVSLVIFQFVYYNYPSYLKEYLLPYRPSYRLRLRHTEYLSFTVPNIFKKSGRRAFKFKAPLACLGL